MTSPPAREASYGWIEEPAWLRVRDYHLRWVLTLPRSPEPPPAVLFLAGLGAQSIAAPLAEAHPRDGRAALLKSFADAGFVTARVERSGVGESSGPAYDASDLEPELDGYTEALASLFRSPFVDPSRVFLFGHSLGGVLAPLLADRCSIAEGSSRPLGQLAGLIVYGTPSRPWSEALMLAAYRQLALAGLSADAIEAEAERAAKLYTRLFRRGFDEARVRAEAPELASSFAAADLRGSTLHGRSLDFFRALDAIDVESAWRRVSCPVLALQGEHDWIVAEDDHDHIASFCASNKDAAACTLLGVDHDLQRHPSVLSSFRGRGKGEADHEAAIAAIAWMRRRRAPLVG